MQVITKRLLAAAGCNFFMGVPGSDDVMLNYQSTSYHDALAVRRLFGKRPAPEFLDWLESLGIFRVLPLSAYSWNSVCDVECRPILLQFFRKERNEIAGLVVEGDSAFNLHVAFVEMLECHKSGYRRADD